MTTTPDTREDTPSELDEILMTFFNEAEADAHSDNFKNGTLITKSHTKAKAVIERLIVEARIDELKHIWNATQPSIVPEGWQPETLEAKLMYDRLATLTNTESK